MSTKDRKHVQAKRQVYRAVRVPEAIPAEPEPAPSPELDWRSVKDEKPRGLDEYLCLTEEGRLVVLRCNPEVAIDPNGIWWDTLHDSGRVIAWASIPRPDVKVFKSLVNTEPWDN